MSFLPAKHINTKVLFTLFSALFIMGGTYFAIRYAKGQRPSSDGTVRETGLLVANSFPTAAEIYINDKLTSATDDTLNLNPGEYQIEIRKEGYTSWKKKFQIEKQIVTQTNALLFPSVPSLSPVTFTGVENLVPAPDGQKLVFHTASASAEAKNGLYVADLTDSPLSLQRGARQISTESRIMDLETAHIIWSPDSSELIVTDGDNYRLLDLSQVNEIDTMTDISLQAETILSSWEEEMYLRERQILAKFPDEIVSVATSSAVNVYFSPDQEKMLYTATQEVVLPEQIIPPVTAASTQMQQRTLKPGETYIYDRKEDRNFLIGNLEQNNTRVEKKLLVQEITNQPLTLEASPSAFLQLQASTSAQTAEKFQAYHSGLFSGNLQWYPDSAHVIRTLRDRINIVQYDSSNEVTVYGGPFSPAFVYPWSNGDKLLILTSFTQTTQSPLNLYAIQLK